MKNQTYTTETQWDKLPAFRESEFPMIAGNLIDGVTGPTAQIYTAGGSPVLSLEPGDLTQHGRDSIHRKKEFIVRAVNSHQALVEACEAALQVAEIGFNPLDQSTREISATTLQHLANQLRAALAAAKGEA